MVLLTVPNTQGKWFIAYLGKFSVMIQCPQCIELFKGNDQSFRWRGIHEIEMNQIIDTQTLEKKNHVPQICSLDLQKAK